jgi:histone acetyltransferase
MRALYPASHNINELDDNKLSIKIARHAPCGSCTSCTGLHPPLGYNVVLDSDVNDEVDRMLSHYGVDSDDEGDTQYMDICGCGHGIIHHGADKKVLGEEEFKRRGRAAVRLDELLQVRGTMFLLVWTDVDSHEILGCWQVLGLHVFR